MDVWTVKRFDCWIWQQMQGMFSNLEVHVSDY